MADLDFDDLWPVAPPPADFARRVVARRHRRRRIAMAVAACGLLLAAGLQRALRGPVSGSANPLARSTIDLNGRGLAVAEPGAALRWTVQRGGEAQVSQPAGDVFYRVEPGAPFQVIANQVSISVTGTCFRVEVIPMKPLVASAAGAAAGAAMASAVLITVYEGRVAVAAGGGAAAPVSAGEQARVEPGAAVAVQAQPARAAPQAGPAGAAVQPIREQLTREQLVERDNASRQQIAALQAHVQQLEKERATLLSRKPADEEAAAHDPEGLPPRNKTRDFTSAELQAMARSCEVRIDLPPLEGDRWKLSPDEGARLHLSEDQQPRVAAAVNKVRDEAIARLRALYLSATGDAGGAQSLAPGTLGQELLHKSRPAEVDAARARIARERAGLETPPPDPATGTIPEQYFRYMVTVGDAVQRELEPTVGATQAGVIRDRVDGWHQTMNGCKEPAGR